MYIHAPGMLSALQRSTKAQKVLAALGLSPALFWAKAVVHSQTHAEQDVGKHARSAHKTNGNSVLGE